VASLQTVNEEFQNRLARMDEEAQSELQNVKESRREMQLETATNLRTLMGELSAIEAENERLISESEITMSELKEEEMKKEEVRPST
jgi:hypothetical protein